MCKSQAWRGDEPVSRAYRQLNLLDPNSTLEELVDKLGTAPLCFPPGTQWRYGLSIDVLWRLVEVVSRRSLDEFFRTRLFDPLGMKDTGFFVSKEQADRVTNVYRLDEAGRLLLLPEARAYDAYTRGRNRLLSGGGGLVSTASDYLRFAQMLLYGGQLDGVRILGPKTIELMSMNQLPDGVTLSTPKLQGHGYGFAVSVLTDVAKSPTVGSVGDFG